MYVHHNPVLGIMCILVKHQLKMYLYNLVSNFTYKSQKIKSSEVNNHLSYSFGWKITKKLYLIKLTHKALVLISYRYGSFAPSWPIQSLGSSAYTVEVGIHS